MMKIYIAFCACMLMFIASATAQTALEGKVVDGENGEPVIFGSVALYKNGVLITGTETDFDGNYSFNNIDAGTYDVEVSYVGYQPQRQVGVVVLAGKTVRLDFEMSSGVLLEEVEIVDYEVPLIEQDNTTQGGVVTAEKILNLPTKDINALAATTAGISSIDGGAIAVRGSRTNATDYYIDGIRVTGNLIPQSEIDQMQVITGGIEARYGDVTGGIISITSKGPSSQFVGQVEVETSQFLDGYGYNLIQANFSGPILKNDRGQSILGYRISGQFINRQDDNPRAFGVYRATDEVIDDLEENPLMEMGGVFFNRAEFIDESDVELLKAQPNTENTRTDLTAKIDARLSKAIDITLTGTYNGVDNIFNRGNATDLFNWRNNPETTTRVYRGNFRFRHRIGANSVTSGSDDSKKAALIRNASYTLQFGYEKRFTETQSIRHQDRLFEYAHVGNFDNRWAPGIGSSDYSGGVPIFNPLNGEAIDTIAHAGYNQGFFGWTPGQFNPVLANYNKVQGDAVNEMTQFNAFNSFWSDVHSTTWSGIHANVGSVYNQFSKGEQDLYTFLANSTFDLFPGGSDKGRHQIEFGFLYEQRTNRNYAINPRRLWEIARLQANSHIIGVDTNVIIGTFTDTVFNGFETVVTEFDQFQTLINENPEALFYKSVRERLGVSINDYVNVDGLDPSQLSIDLFAPSELNNQRILNYWGYDYTGNKISANTTFDDFFTDFDEEGRRNFTVAPFQPIYTAGYIQDKFTFKDIIFRLGVRVDRYDANTRVLADQFSLYPIIEANDFYDGPGQNEERPANVGDDWKVYVATEGSTNVRAFRDGNQWYTAEGSPVNDGNVIFGGEIVNPYYVEQDVAQRNIKSRNFDPNGGSFEDYEPQVNVMPRLAFSFPISDEANFFAHYDILVQRPPTNSVLTALDFYYFEDDFNQGVNNNPNLRPEKTIAYEVGFKQKLTNSSALTLSAYYKELRDMIQQRTILYVPPPVNQYTTYDNLDFGTVKAFSVTYDLRRTNNLEITASYTLQFADGTGSDANSQGGLSQRGNIRTLFPLSFDERHRIVANVDYRYGSGRRYNGPRIGGSDILANFGVGVQFTAVSGRPYTATQQPTQFGGTGFTGSINGARLPWNFTVDLRANKQFRLNSGADADKKPLYLDVYFRVQNLFDTRNIVGVYSATGSPDDDGYLQSFDGQAALNTLEQNGRDTDAFVTAYDWRLLNNGFFTLPRRMYIGAIFNF